MRRTLETAILAALGAAAFMMLGLPAAPILGGMMAVAAAALAGRSLGFSPAIRAPQLAIMGLAAGGSFSPAMLAAAATWPLSLLALLGVSIAMQACGYLVFRRVGNFEPLTAFLAAAPGSLSAVLILADEHGADVPRVAVPQTLRVTFIIALTPFLLMGAVPPNPVSTAALIDGRAAWALVLVVAGLGWLLASRLRWPLPPFLGTLVGSAALHAGGTVSVQPPGWLLTIALAGLGGVIGSRFSGVRPRDVGRLLPVSLLAIAITACVGVGSGLLVGWLAGVGAYPGLLAFAPGSMEMMIAVALTLNLQPAYVTAHHIFRTLLLLSTVPLAVRLLLRRTSNPRR